MADMMMGSYVYSRSLKDGYHPILQVDTVDKCRLLGLTLHLSHVSSVKAADY